jgi:hypothetical protein
MSIVEAAIQECKKMVKDTGPGEADDGNPDFLSEKNPLS